MLSSVVLILTAGGLGTPVTVEAYEERSTPPQALLAHARVLLGLEPRANPETVVLGRLLDPDPFGEESVADSSWSFIFDDVPLASPSGLQTEVRVQVVFDRSGALLLAAWPPEPPVIPDEDAEWFASLLSPEDRASSAGWTSTGRPDSVSRSVVEILGKAWLQMLPGNGPQWQIVLRPRVVNRSTQWIAQALKPGYPLGAMVALIPDSVDSRLFNGVFLCPDVSISEPYQIQDSERAEGR